MLTKKQAWEKIAAAFAQYAAGGRKISMGYIGNTSPEALAGYGLCSAVVRLSEKGEIGIATRWQMMEEIRDFQPPTLISAFYWPLTRLGAQHRAMAAAVLAEDASA